MKETFVLSYRKGWDAYGDEKIMICQQFLDTIGIRRRKHIKIEVSNLPKLCYFKCLWKDDEKDVFVKGKSFSLYLNTENELLNLFNEAVGDFPFWVKISKA